MSADGLKIASGLTLPIDALTRTTAIVGQRGTGKTSTAVVLVEEAARVGAQAAVIDPTGAWYGLRSAADGERGGIPVVVFGGHHGDVPLEAEAGRYVARLVVEKGLSVVLDLELMTKGKQVQFVAEFVEELYHRNREALTLVIDEAHRFAPQQLRDPGGFGARCLGAVEDAVSLGRRKGIGAVLISQRPAKISKNVFEQAEIMVVHRLMGPNDRKAIAGWLDEAVGDASEVGSVTTLEPQHATVWAPALGVFGRFHIRRKRTFDSSATPEVGEAAIEPRGRAKVDLVEVERAMSESIERAKASDPKTLRAEVARLRRRVDELEAAPPPVPEVERVEVPVLGDDVVAAIRALDERMQAAMVRWVGAPPVSTMPAPRAPLPRRDPAPAPRVTARSQQPAAPSGDVGNGGLRRILVALAQHPEGLTRRQIGLRATLSARGGTFNTYLSKARTSGWIEDAGDRVRLTSEGLDALGDFEPLPQGRELLAHYLGDLGSSGAARILQVLADAYPEAVAKEDLGAATGLAPNAGTFNTYLSKLRTLELIEGRGELRMSEDLA